MPTTTRHDRLGLEGLHASTWAVIVLVGLSILCAALQIARVGPYLWPAGAGASIEGDPAAALPLMARPPRVQADAGRPATLARIAPDSAAALADLHPGDVVLTMTREGRPAADLSHLPTASAAGRLDAWRDAYHLGVEGPVTWRVRSRGADRIVPLDRAAAWRSPNFSEWARRHLGMVVQIVVFTGAALLLLVLRSNDRTAGLSVAALALSAIGGGGPLLGAEHVMPLGLGHLLAVLAWVASPLAFPIIALAILYFPSRSPLLDRHPALHAVPFLTAAPMLVPSLATALYLGGVDGARGLAVWDASHPAVYYLSFAAALALNVAVILEGVYRYRFNHDANERRRIRMAVYTGVPGVLAYAIKDGWAIAGGAAGLTPPSFPTPLVIVLQALVLLPAFGLVYAVGVDRVLGPRLVLRRSLQYALASRTLTVVAILPALALVLSLAYDGDKTIRDVAKSAYVVLIPASLAAFWYRDRARQWLDQRFFRQEYDARKILLSLASRVRFETDPADLAALVVTQIDEALHPEMTAILVTGIDEGRLTPVTVLYGSAESLPLDGGLVAMLRWSDEPLEIFLADPRSPALRLPPDEREWLECTNAALLVPVVDQERALIALIALGEKRSEEIYTAEDRQLLATIASQMGLGFDVARLRRRTDSATTASPETTRMLPPAAQPMVECPRCGRCEEAGTALCPADGVPMHPVLSVPHVVDHKYRVEQLLGRGGMGAVYRARDMRLDRLVALKVVRAELLGDPEAVRRFRREAQIVARLQHPGIVSVFDYGTFADGGAYLVMELVRGEDLRRVLQREGRLDSERALPILTTVCAAIEAAHREGVLHRDLKPENILLPGGDAGVKVLDFGVAKVMADDPREGPAETATVLTVAGTIIGTPAYMAPEQFHGAAADARTDVFSLGVIAYEMLSGELPFGRGSLADIVLAQSRGVAPMPAGTVSPALDRAVRAALEPDPDRRPATPQAFAHLLGAAMQL